MKGGWKLASAWLREERGTALLEFAISLPVLLLLVLGAVNYTLRIQAAMQLAEAASAGAMFGTIPGNQSNTAGMTAAARNAAPGLAGMTVQPPQVLRSCIPGGTNVPSTTACAGYGTPIQYVQVTVSANLPALFAWPGVSPTITVNQTATFRVPWTQ